MGIEERMKRKEKRNRIKRTRLITVTAVVLLCLAGWFFTNSQFVKGLIYKNSTYEKNTVLEVDKSITGSYSVFKNDILFTTKNGLCLYSMDGKLIHTANYDEVSSVIATYQEPVVKSFTDEICAFDKSGRKFIVFNNKKIIHNGETEYNIQNVRVFDNGCFAVITADAGAKNQMILYNEKGKKEFVWHSGVDNIIDVSIAPNGNKIAIVSAELVPGTINTGVYMFNRGETEAYAQKKYEKILMTNISFLNNSELIGVSDVGIYYIDASCNEKKSYTFNDKFLSYFKITDNGTIVLNFSSISDSTSCTEIVKNGKLKGSYISDKPVKSLDVKNGNILLRHDSSAEIISMRGKFLRKIDCKRELANTYFIGKNKILLVEKTDVKIIR